MEVADFYYMAVVYVPIPLVASLQSLAANVLPTLCFGLQLFCT